MNPENNHPSLSLKTPPTRSRHRSVWDVIFWDSYNRIKMIILCSILGLSLCSMAFFILAYVKNKSTIGQGQAFYAALSADFKSHPPPITPPQRQASVPLQAPAQLNLPIPPVPHKKHKETPKNEEAASINFKAKQESFPDIVAWIISEGTVINYPIVQGEDNGYYLNRLADGSRNAMGSIFMDYRNNADFSDSSIILYGHDMPSGDMFASLKHYARQDYYEQFPSMSISTPKQDFKLVLFAGYILDSSYEVPPLHFSDAIDFENFIEDIKKRSVFKSEFEPQYGDQIIFLATCTAGGPVNERFIVAAKLISL